MQDRVEVSTGSFKDMHETMTFKDDNHLLDALDCISDGIPFTHPRICHLLYHLVLTLEKPQIVEIACAYGKATLYLSAGAKVRDGFLRTVDIVERKWKGRSVLDLLNQANLRTTSEVTFDCDARWYLLNLIRQYPGQWIDLAYLDLTHTIEDDSFVALALWTHMRPGGILVFDDLDWIPAAHGPSDLKVQAPQIGHMRILYNYMCHLPEVADRAEWGKEEVEWTWGFLRKNGEPSEKHLPLRDLLEKLDETSGYA